MHVSRIQTNHNPAFKSKITPKLPEQAADITKDYWKQLFDDCHKTNQLPRLNKILDKLAGNGDNNILAIEHECNQFGVNNYHISLYESIKSLLVDRQTDSISERKNYLAGSEWVQNFNGQAYRLNYDGELTSNQIEYKGAFASSNAILDLLDKITQKDTAENKKFFGLNFSKKTSSQKD